MDAPPDDSDRAESRLRSDQPLASGSKSLERYRLKIRKLMAGKRVLIADYQAELPTTGVVLLLGENGAGKSLLLRAMSQVDHGQDVHLQTAQDEPVPVAAVLDFPGFLSADRLADVVRKARWFGSDADALSENLARLDVDLPANSTVSQWSLGNRQRVRIAAAIASPRKVLLMDEPFRSIDEGHLHSLIALLAKDAERRLILVSTHRPELLAGLATAALILSGDTVPRVPQLATPSGRSWVQVAGRGLDGPDADTPTLEMQSQTVDQGELQDVLQAFTSEDAGKFSLLVRPDYSVDGEDR